MEKPRRLYPADIRERAFAYYARLNELQAFCEKHHAEAISLERAAGVVGLEASYFSTFFRAKVGIGFHDWLNYLRITHAQLLLQGDDSPLKDIARTVGFGSYSTFERAFKRCAGMTPRAYRQENCA